jgi:hypothetical protein
MNRLIAGLAATASLAVVPAGSVAAPQPQPDRIDAAATPYFLTWGTRATVAGKLTARKAGRKVVTLLGDPYPYGDGYAQLATTTTASNGTYSFTLTPRQNINYRVRSGGLEASTANRVRKRLTLAVSDSTPRRGQLVRFSGYVLPKHNGLVLHLQRRNSTGRYVTVARTTTQDATLNRSRFSLSLRIYSSGVYRAWMGHDGDHLSGVSPSRTLTRS